MEVNDKLIEEERMLTERIEANPDDADARYRRGRVRWRMGDRAGAISDYEHAAAADPSSPAAAALQMTRQIMDFYNPDLLNP
ncbi:MAG: hypothetical protein K2N16_01670 [Muribaculaceae bacterium]|nr:hypothetical protein [Muribaculaceae bacterium]